MGPLWNYFSVRRLVHCRWFYVKVNNHFGVGAKTQIRGKKFLELFYCFL